MHDLGIEIMGFFIIGWDDDTVDTYHRTLDFCDQTGVIPLIFSLTPMPGSKLYEDYLAAGRILTDRPWDQYGGGYVVYKHPTMSEQDMLKANAEVMREGYTMGRIMGRTVNTIRRRFSMDVAMSSFFTQLGLRKAYRQLYDDIQAPS